MAPHRKTQTIGERSHEYSARSRANGYLARTIETLETECISLYQLVQLTRKTGCGLGPGTVPKMGGADLSRKILHQDGLVVTCGPAGFSRRRRRYSGLRLRVRCPDRRQRAARSSLPCRAGARGVRARFRLRSQFRNRSSGRQRHSGTDQIGAKKWLGRSLPAPIYIRRGGRVARGSSIPGETANRIARESMALFQRLFGF